MAKSPIIFDLEFKEIPGRKLSEDTCRLFGYGFATQRGERVQVANYADDTGRTVAQKTRTAAKAFKVLGDLDKAGLFGQQLWKDGGRMVVITEGELDAMSVAEAYGSKKWPVVSIPTGAKGAAKAIRKSLEWLEKFETVVLMFDMDDEGRKAVTQCIELFTPGKCKIAHLPLKDANEMLKAGRTEELIHAIWQAKAVRPDGIVNGLELWDALTTEPEFQTLDYPWVGLNSMTHGCRRGEMVMVTGGTGIGKSELVGQIGHHFLTVHGETVGVIALEENRRQVAQRYVGLAMGERLRLLQDPDPDKLKKAYDEEFGPGKFWMYDHWGSLDSDTLFNKIRYLARGCGASTIILDHISIVVSGIETDDERKAIDVVMTKLRSMVEELNIRLITVCHLKKNDGKPHEEGGHVTINDLRGSGSLKQVPDIIIAGERNTLDPEEKFWLKLIVLKNRFSGQTGEACQLKYQAESGVLKEAFPEFETEVNNGVKGEDF